MISVFGLQSQVTKQKVELYLGTRKDLLKLKHRKERTERNNVFILLKHADSAVEKAKKKSQIKAYSLLPHSDPADHLSSSPSSSQMISWGP